MALKDGKPEFVKMCGNCNYYHSNLYSLPCALCFLFADRTSWKKQTVWYKIKEFFRKLV